MRQNLIRINKIKIFTFSALIFIIFGASPVTAEWTLPDEYITPDENFKIFYTTDATAQPLNAVTRIQVEQFGTILERERTKALEYGYDAPPSQIPTYIFDQGINAHGNCGYNDFDPYFLGVPDSARGSPREIEKQLVVLHEFMHSIQYCYSHSLATGGGAWITEGQARMIQDKYYSALDNADGTEFASYYGQVSGYLGNPSRSLFDLSYDAALFWQYVAEKYGNINREPDLGVDVILQFWESLQALGDSRPTIERVFSHMFTELGDSSATLKKVYKDFIVANYAKDIPFAPSKYHYIDETQTPGSYPLVTFDLDRNIQNDQSIGGVESLGVYYPKYFRLKPQGTVDFVNIQIDQITNIPLFIDVIKVTGSTFEEIKLETRRGLNVTIPNAGDYDEIVVIVSGLNSVGTHSPKFNYLFHSGGQKSFIQILNPTTDNPAFFGEEYIKPNFNAVVRVFNGTDPIRGLSTSDFRTSIGTVISSVYVSGIYILNIRPSPSTYGGDLDLTIEISPSIRDTQTDAIHYYRDSFDRRDNTMLVIDTSFSMVSNEKIQAAKTAARIFAETYGPDTFHLGLAEFSTDANIIVPLNAVSANRGTVLSGITNLIADGGSTSVGDGLYAALEEIYTHTEGVPGIELNQYKKIIILTDGKENTPKWINDVRGLIKDNRTHLYAVILGTDAEGEQLQSLTEQTVRGETFYAFEPASGTLASDLADIYRTIAKKDTAEYTVYKDKGIYNSSSWTLNKQFNVNAQGNVSVLISYRSKFQPSGVQLHLPNGTAINPHIISNYPSGLGHYGYMIWKIQESLNGEYTVQFSSSSDYLEYYLEAYSTGPYSTDIHFNLPTENRAVGIPIPILFSLSDELNSIKGATVTVKITSGTDYKSFYSWNVTLFDDGLHDDGYPNDGVYGTIFTQTIFDGGYIVDVVANGFDNKGKEYVIFDSEGFMLKVGGDKDQDQLPDTWENLYGLRTDLNTGNDGPTGDPDLDLLQNYYEFIFGSNPLLPDTDFGGELDLSEAAKGRSVTEPSDDTIYPVQLIGEPGNTKAIIHLQYEGNLTQIALYRSSTPDGPFNLITSSITPEMSNYTDGSLTNAQTYYYSMLGITDKGIYTGYSNVIAVTPKADVISPDGYFVINNNQKVTEDPVVRINLGLSPSSDVVSIEVASNPKFTGSTSYTPGTPIYYTLPERPGLHYIYMRLIDAGGNFGGFHNGDYAFAGIIYLTDETTTSSTLPESSSSSGTSSPFNLSWVFITAPALIVLGKLIKIRKKKLH